MTEAPESSTRPGNGSIVHPKISRWTDRRVLWLHALALALVLTSLLAVVDNGHAGFPDEGIYAAQVDNLSKGSWSAPLPDPSIDPDGEWVGMTGSEVTNGSYIPYARHAAYPLFLLPFYELAGFGGMLASSTLSVLAASILCAFLARRLDVRLGIPALWLLGVGSPLVFDSVFLVGHATAAALFALLTLLVTWIVDDGRTRWLLLAVPTAAALAMLRSEGVVAVAALGLYGLAAAVPWRQRAGSRRAAATAAMLLVTGAAAFLIDGAIARSIVGSAEAATGILDRDKGPLSAAWTSLIRPWHGPMSEIRVSMVLVMLTSVLAAVALRVVPRRPLMPVAALTLGAVAAAAHLLEPPRLIPGLLATMPLLIFGISCLDSRTIRSALVGRLLGTSVIACVAIVMTSYETGGATEWGGRFFHVLLPLLIPVALIGTGRFICSIPRSLSIAAIAAMVVTALPLSVTALRTNADYRRAHERIVETTLEFVHAHAVSKRPVLAMSTLSPTGTARVFWKQAGEGTAVLSAPSLGSVHHMLRATAGAGQAELFVVANVDHEILSGVLGSTLKELGWGVTDHRQVGDTYWEVTRFGPNELAN